MNKESNFHENKTHLPFISGFSSAKLSDGDDDESISNFQWIKMCTLIDILP